MSDIQEYGMIVNDAEENKVMIGFFDSDDHAIRAFFTAPDEMQEIFSEISPSEMFLFYGYKDEGEFRIKEKIGLYTFDACNGNVMKFIEEGIDLYNFFSQLYLFAIQEHGKGGTLQ